MFQSPLHSTPLIHFDEGASGTGGSPAPAAQPAAAPSAEPAPTPSAPSPSPGGPEPSSSPQPSPGPAEGEQKDFTLPHWTGDEDLDSDSVVVPGEPQRAPQQQPPPQQQQPQAPQAPQAPQPPQQQQPVQQQQPAPGVQDRPPLDPTNPAEVAQMLIQNRDAAVQALAGDMYALTPEQVEGLDTNATAMVPELLAQVHVNSVTAALNRMAEMMPYMMQRHMVAVNRNSENASAFYEANKHLDRNNPQIAQAVASMARVYRAQNPQATKPDMIKAVGLLVSQQLGIAAQPQAPVVQQQPVAGFVPAATGGGGGQPPPQPAPDPWAGMAGDYDEE